MNTAEKAATELELHSAKDAQGSTVKTPLCIYIAGYGRSGSTLLDTILGSHERISGAGELSYVFEELRAHGRCSCHKSLETCRHWCSVLGLVKQKHLFRDRRGYELFERVTRKVESLKLTPPRKSLCETYSVLWHEVFKAIAEVSGKDAIVDSSKSTRRTWNRPVLLSKTCGLNVKVIHLVRDPRAVMWSVNRGSNRLLEAGKPAHRFGGMVRGLLGWLFSNLTVEYIKFRLAPEDTLLLQYEALVVDPAVQLKRVGEFLGLPLENLVSAETCKAFGTGHGIAGNRMRRQGTLQVKNDNEWKQALPGSIYLLSLLVWPLARKYGYAIRF